MLGRSLHERTRPPKVRKSRIHAGRFNGSVTTYIQGSPSRCTMTLRRLMSHMSGSTSERDLLPPWIGCIIIVGILGSALIAAPVHAQDMHVGVRAGPAFGFFNDSAVPFVSAGENTNANTNVRLDLHVSAFAIFPLPGRFGLRPELTFVQKGAHFSRAGFRFYTSERYRLSYLQGQLLGQYPISLSGPLSVRISGGVTLDRTLSGAVQRNTWNRGDFSTERIRLIRNDLVRRWDVGALVGIGLQYTLSSLRRVTLTVRYNPGFRSVFTNADLAHRDDGEIEFNPPTLSQSPPELRHDLLTIGLSCTLPVAL